MEELGQRRKLLALALAAPPPTEAAPAPSPTLAGMTEPIDMATRFGFVGHGDVKITSNGRRVIVEIDAGGDTDAIDAGHGNFRRRA